jgi:hypothetical protein
MREHPSGVSGPSALSTCSTRAAWEPVTRGFGGAERQRDPVVRAAGVIGGRGGAPYSSLIAIIWLRRRSRAHAVVRDALGGSRTSRSRPDHEGRAGDVPALRHRTAVAEAGRVVTDDTVTTASTVIAKSDVTSVSGVTAEMAATSETARGVSAAATVSATAATTAAASPSAAVSATAPARTSGGTAASSTESRCGDETNQADGGSECDEVSAHGDVSG